MGPWLSWESAAFASRRPRVRIPSGPPYHKPAEMLVFPLFMLVFSVFSLCKSCCFLRYFCVYTTQKLHSKRFPPITLPHPLQWGGAGRVGGLFWRSLGSKDFFMLTIEWVLTALSDCGRLLAEKLLLDFEEEVINPSGLRVWVLGERTAFLVLLSTKCSVP